MSYSKYQWSNVVFMILLLSAILGITQGFLSIWSVVMLIVCYVSLLVAGSYFIQMNFYFTSLNKLPRFKISFDSGNPEVTARERNVVLTFDDGPHANTMAVLDILKKERVRAVFFLIGKNAVLKPEAVKAIWEAGHQVGNHSYYHKASFDWQSSQKMQAEIQQTSEVLEQIISEPVYLFRPPFGVTNPNLGKAIRLSGMHSIGWSIRSYDTVARDENQLIDRIVRQLHPGAVILLHERCDITVRILPDLIRQIRAKGYSFAAF